MALSSELVSQFVEVTNNSDAKKDSNIYGTVVIKNGTEYVKIDGSESLTPVITTTKLHNDDRVILEIKNHMAVVIGNVTNPSIADKELIKFDEGLDQKAIFNKLTNNGASEGVYMYDGDLYVNASYIKSGTIDAKEVSIKNLDAGSITTGNLSADRIRTGILSSSVGSLGFNLDEGKIYTGGNAYNIILKDGNYVGYDAYGNDETLRIHPGLVHGSGYRDPAEFTSRATPVKIQSCTFYDFGGSSPDTAFNHWDEINNGIFIANCASGYGIAIGCKQANGYYLFLSQERDQMYWAHVVNGSLSGAWF